MILSTVMINGIFNAFLYFLHIKHIKDDIKWTTNKYD